MCYNIYKGCDNLKKVSKFKVELSILIPIILFFIISVVSIYSTKRLLGDEFQNLWLKQSIWYLIGIILAYSTMTLGNKFLYNNAYIFYIIGVISLILVLFFGTTINNATCWFKIPFLGTIQPSEFMKIFLIITLSRMITDFNDTYKNPDTSDELKFIIKVLIVVFIPSVLTFIEPDTGAVIMYLIITFIMLFVGGLKKRWFILTIGIIVLFLGIFLGIYYFPHVSYQSNYFDTDYSWKWAFIVTTAIASPILFFNWFGLLKTNNEYSKEEKKAIRWKFIKMVIFYWLADGFFASWILESILFQFLAGGLCMIIIFVNLFEIVLTGKVFNVWFMIHDFVVGVALTVYLIYIIPNDSVQSIVLTITAALYGGLLTLIGVAWTIKDGQERENESKRLGCMPFLQLEIPT